MNCFNHTDRVAVGVCKSCGKGLCPDCATQRTNGLACRESCEARVDLLNRIIDINDQTLAAARYQTRSVGIVVSVIGVIFLGFAGVLSMSPGWGFNAFLIGCFGATFIVLGVTRLNKRAQYPAPDK